MIIKREQIFVAVFTLVLVIKTLAAPATNSDSSKITTEVKPGNNGTNQTDVGSNRTTVINSATNNSKVTAKSLSNDTGLSSKTDEKPTTSSVKTTSTEKEAITVQPSNKKPTENKPTKKINDIQTNKELSDQTNKNNVGDNSTLLSKGSQQETIAQSDDGKPATNKRTNVTSDVSANKKSGSQSEGTTITNSKEIQTAEVVTTTISNSDAKTSVKKMVIKKEKKSGVNQDTAISTTTISSILSTSDTVTTWDGLPCSSRFRAHPRDKTLFETAFSENVFEKNYQQCPATLIWRQDQCRCGWPEPDPVDTETCSCCNQGLKSHPSNPSMYQRLINGQWLEEACSTYDNNQLWDDEKCSCVWDPNKPQSHRAPVFKGNVLPRLMTQCMNLVNMTLDEGLKDDSGRDLTPLFGGQRIRVVDEKGNIGKSIEIRRAPFKIGIFNGNDLQSTVYFKFNFKVHNDHVRMRDKMVIMSNGCKRRWQKNPIQPSLEVSFFPFNETFEVQFSTTSKTVVEYITGTKDVNGWYQCVLYLQDRVLNLKVNGQKVYSTNGMSGRVKSTDCPLTVAGSPTNPSEHFDGYLDELQVVKQCKYEPDTV